MADRIRVRFQVPRNEPLRLIVSQEWPETSLAEFVQILSEAGADFQYDEHYDSIGGFDAGTSHWLSAIEITIANAAAWTAFAAAFKTYINRNRGKKIILDDGKIAEIHNYSFRESSELLVASHEEEIRTTLMRLNQMIEATANGHPADETTSEETEFFSDDTDGDT